MRRHPDLRGGLLIHRRIRDVPWTVRSPPGLDEPKGPKGPDGRPHLFPNGSQRLNREASCVPTMRTHNGGALHDLWQPS